MNEEESRDEPVCKVFCVWVRKDFIRISQLFFCFVAHKWCQTTRPLNLRNLLFSPDFFNIPYFHKTKLDLLKISLVPWIPLFPFISCNLPR